MRAHSHIQYVYEHARLSVCHCMRVFVFGQAESGGGGGGVEAGGGVVKMMTRC